MNCTERLYLASLLEKQAMAATAGKMVGQVGSAMGGVGQKIINGYNNFMGGVQNGYTQGQNQAQGIKPLVPPPQAPKGTMSFNGRTNAPAAPR